MNGIEELYEKLDIKFKDSMGYKKISILSVEKEVAEFMYFFVKMIKPKIVLETGSGLSTLLMAHALNQNGEDGHIYSFDIARQEERIKWFEKAELLNNVTLMNGSVDNVGHALVGKVNNADLIHLDADHSYEAVMGELNDFARYISKGTYILFHDSTHKKFIDKVGKAITDFFSKVPHQRIDIPTAFGLTMVKVL